MRSEPEESDDEAVEDDGMDNNDDEDPLQYRRSRMDHTTRMVHQVAHPGYTRRRAPHRD